jgi:ABC-type Na+ transport system ATPase subunit NatA
MREQHNLLYTGTFYLINLLIEIVSVFSAHSMEEAEVLCDRLGIFVVGSLQCIGNPKEVS